MDKIIDVSGLKKSFGSVQAVAGIDFYVEKGSLFAFLGPNGAGKSTTIDIICTLMKADEGNVSINGMVLSKDDDAIRKQIGVVFQDSVLDSLLTVKENLLSRASLYGQKGNELKKSVDNAIQISGVRDFKDRPYGKLSGGQRRRADIARALVHTPSILFLDEPTTGLDPQTRKNVWDTIRDLQLKTGMTVFLTTHYMEEAAKADYIAVIDHGVISAKGTPSQLREQYSRDRLIITPTDFEKLGYILGEMGVPYDWSGGNATIFLQSTIDAIPVIKQCEPYIRFLEVISGSMDDAFIAITGEGSGE